ncbi:hypothetical protein K1T71_000590 [Dendrolimus kikuchii]|uniref:Uncharacterized protein n=1 Tax=Dendrolimus kikuchii TaxID=765133 RepID=A0ACC1DKK3_9NEOP|nr:hypothetical protein K1T71_000590 [Dendrolimus kikuchii]
MRRMIQSCIHFLTLLWIWTGILHGFKLLVLILWILIMYINGTRLDVDRNDVMKMYAFEYFNKGRKHNKSRYR